MNPIKWSNIFFYYLVGAYSNSPSLIKTIPATSFKGLDVFNVFVCA